ncbi:hypothetical protein FIBSPDRAFT_742039 [Athelia psychrophila]|uniref:glutathione transferase n=1 Tax=Athelia psychrophila TaxID=1759441 RepID=A0A166J8S9_9AGAM|nr:hypothetical protein FIBSPDRAFT_742039 [Fibularhizoctonia sp. CBS 109695]
MALKLYGSPYSTSTKCVAIVALLWEKNVPFEFIAINLIKGEHKVPTFVARQPFWQVPFIMHCFILYESRGTGHYIASKYASQGPSLIPTSDLKTAALFEQALNHRLFHLAGMYRRFVPIICGIQGVQEADEAVVVENKALDVYKIILSKQPYVAGNALTPADLFHLSCRAGVGGDLLQTVF